MKTAFLFLLVTILVAVLVDCKPSKAPIEELSKKLQNLKKTGLFEGMERSRYEELDFKTDLNSGEIKRGRQENENRLCKYALVVLLNDLVEFLVDISICPK